MPPTTPLLAPSAPAVHQTGPTAPAQPPSWWGARRGRRATEARLRRADLASAHRAELHRLQAALADARALVEHGWVQGAWLQVGTADGGSRTVPSATLHLADPRLVTGVCLVGAVVRSGSAAGPDRPALSPMAAQLVRRTLDATWQTLRAHEVRPGRACAPAVLRARVRELTRWNDAPGRTAGEVSALLARAEDRVRAAAAVAA